jgi:hypothetical protein
MTSFLNSICHEAGPKMKKFNRKRAVGDNAGEWMLRAFHRKKTGKRSPRLLVKCGCCDEAVEIYYDEYGVEINGVHASREEWRKVLMPILEGYGEDPFEMRR